MNTTMTIAGIIIAITGAIFGIQQLVIPLWKKVMNLFETWGKFIRDWEGEEGDAGRDPVPGVMARLNKLDGELTNNGGKSLKDKVDKLSENQGKIFRMIEDAETQRREMHETLLAAIQALSPQKAKEKTSRKRTAVSPAFALQTPKKKK